MLDAKLQIKPRQTIAIIGGPKNLTIKAPKASEKNANVIFVFVKNKTELNKTAKLLELAGKRGAMIWIAYPKAGQLDTDLNRDILHELMPKYHLDAVRQIAIDAVWSAMRFKYLDDK